MAAERVRYLITKTTLCTRNVSVLSVFITSTRHPLSVYDIWRQVSLPMTVLDISKRKKTGKESWIFSFRQSVLWNYRFVSVWFHCFIRLKRLILWQIEKQNRHVYGLRIRLQREYLKITNGILAKL